MKRMDLIESKIAHVKEQLALIKQQREFVVAGYGKISPQEAKALQEKRLALLENLKTKDEAEIQALIDEKLKLVCKHCQQAINKELPEGDRYPCALDGAAYVEIVLMKLALGEVE